MTHRLRVLFTSMHLERLSCCAKPQKGQQNNPHQINHQRKHACNKCRRLEVRVDLYSRSWKPSPAAKIGVGREHTKTKSLKAFTLIQSLSYSSSSNPYNLFRSVGHASKQHKLVMNSRLSSGETSVFTLSSKDGMRRKVRVRKRCQVKVAFDHFTRRSGVLDQFANGYKCEHTTNDCV